jgi:Domain of unknown function (DUF4145)
MEAVVVRGWSERHPLVVSLRCPRCRKVGVFESGPTKDFAGETSVESVSFGSRRCPDPKCTAQVFVILADPAGTLVASYPPETIDFDSTNLPKPVLDALDEAIRCHASQCFRAAALLVRRTLEELCLDRQATGGNLKDRLKSLSGRIAVAEALVDGFDSLRLLGNDAAHVELKDFDSIGSTEAGLAIEIVKELLKGVYQYDDLVARLEAFKRPPSP